MPPTERYRLLVVDDEEGIRFMISEVMKKEGYHVDEAVNGREAVERAVATDYDVIILDIKMPEMNGIEALKEMRRRRVQSVVVVITAHGNQEVGMEAITAGAYDYFSKPFELDEFRTVVRRALERRQLEKEIDRLQSQIVAEHTYGKMIGQCEPIRRVYDMIESVAPKDVTVLIRGESGTGKELIAREIHERSMRSKKPFVSINCAAIPDTLLESELFGYERGAFTGATAAKPGRFEVADGGTIFLDEIGDMPLALQAKLLRALQEREIERVGGTKPIKVDIRILAATNQDLEAQVKDGAFREDLFFRLNVIPINLPPLRERVDDIPALTRHFVRRFCAEFGKRLHGVDDDVLKVFVRHDWPGNIREMENVLQRAVIMASEEVIHVRDLTENLQRVAKELETVTSAVDVKTPLPETMAPPPAPGLSIGDAELADFDRPLSKKIADISDRIERRAIELALEKTGGKREETADLLGLSRKSLYNKMQKLGLG